MRAALRIIDLVGYAAGAFAAILVFGIAGLIIAEVVARSGFGVSLTFAWEFAAYFLATSIFCGAAYTMRTGGHVRVALLKGALGETGNRIMDILATVAAVAASGFLAVSLILFAWRSFERGSVSPTIDQTPLVIPQAAIAFGAMLLALQLVARLIRLIIGEPPEDTAARETFSVE